MANGTEPKPMGYRTLIPDNSNLDNFIASSNETAFFNGGNISTMTNRPSALSGNVPFAMDVVNLSGYILQILYPYSANGTPSEYRRQTYYDSGSRPFGEWVKTI